MCYVIFIESRREVEEIDSNENLTRLVNQYQNLIFSICLKITGDYFAAEDLTQETFLSAYKHWEEFDGQAEKAWICRIAGNKSIDYCREAARRQVPTLKEDMPPEALVQKEEPLRQTMNREILRELEKSCKSLSPPYDQIALQHFLQNKPAKEIAEQSGVGLNTVKTQIYRAKEMLRKSFRKEMLME